MPLPHEGGTSFDAVGLGDGNIHLFSGYGRPNVSTYGGNVWHAWTEPDPYHWQTKWEILGGQQDHPALDYLQGLCATTWDGVNIHVFASSRSRHPDTAYGSRVSHIWTQHGPSNWSQLGWINLCENPDVYPMPTSPDICSATDWNNSNLQLFMFDGDVLVHKWTNKSGLLQNWNPDGWVPIGNYLKQHKTFGCNTAACRWADGNIQVFAWNDGSVLYHMWTEPDPYHWNQGGWVPYHTYT
jgi:hypothetical protein